MPDMTAKIDDEPAPGVSALLSKLAPTDEQQAAHDAETERVAAAVLKLREDVHRSEAAAGARCTDPSCALRGFTHFTNHELCPTGKPRRPLVAIPEAPSARDLIIDTARVLVALNSNSGFWLAPNLSIHLDSGSAYDGNDDDLRWVECGDVEGLLALLRHWRDGRWED